MTDPMDELANARDAVDAMVRRHAGSNEQIQGLVDDAMNMVAKQGVFGLMTLLTNLAWKAYVVGLEKGMSGEAVRATATRILDELERQD